MKLEIQESKYWTDFFNYCEENLKERLKLSVDKICDSVCCSAASVDVLAFNRVLCVGLNESITKQLLKEIIDFYRSQSVKRFFIQISPAAKPENYVELINEAGFRFHNNWAKFYKPLLEKIPEPKTHLEITELKDSEIGKFNDILQSAFEFENGLENLMTQSFNKSGWKHYLVKENNNPISAGSLFVETEIATLAIAGTHPNARGKGAQTLLIIKRINEAIKSGCKYVSVETAEDKPEKPAPSFRNMQRFGFELAYLRPNFIYEF